MNKVMEPLISIQLFDHQPAYQPGDTLVCDYQIDAVRPDEMQSVEASVLWYTEGKGEEDMAVHYFERRLPADVENGDLRQLRRFETVLPKSPLSYNGNLINVQWCVRVRTFLQQGRDAHFDYPFQLENFYGDDIVECLEH